MTDLNTLRASLDSGEHLFADTLAFVAAGYDYQPQAFTNGTVETPPGRTKVRARPWAWPCWKG